MVFSILLFYIWYCVFSLLLQLFCKSIPKIIEYECQSVVSIRKRAITIKTTKNDEKEKLNRNKKKRILIDTTRENIYLYNSTTLLLQQIHLWTGYHVNVHMGFINFSFNSFSCLLFTDQCNAYISIGRYIFRFTYKWYWYIHYIHNIYI